MMDAARHETAVAVLCRFPVDMSVDEGAIDARVERLLDVLPTGSAARLSPFGFSFRREVDAFSAIAVGPMLGTGILVVEYSRKVAFLSYMGLILAAVFFSLALYLAGRFLKNHLARVEVVAEGPEIVRRSWLGRRLVEERRFDASQVVVVQVLQPPGEPQRVVLGGPRHALLGEVFRVRLLDPERLGPWMAEMVALVARRASLSLRA